MTVGKRYFKALAVFALGALVSAGAIGQVTTRFTVPGGSATTSKILPGGTVSFDVRIDAPATPTIGSAFRILQTSPAAPSSFFTITARSFVGSIYNDTASGSSDALVFALPSALLKPQNDDNLGRNTVGLVATAAGTNLFIANYTLTSNAATPLGVYRIQPTTGGTSTVTGDAPTFTDYDMSAALFDVIVGQTLTITKSGTGTGTVTSDVGAINCGATCSEIYPGSTVTLAATPDIGTLFLGWTGGGCSGTGPCVVTVTTATTVNAQFGFSVDGLNVLLAGAGSGAVTSAPAGISCPATCAAGFAFGTLVTLTATPAGGSVFSGWSGGGCSGTGPCVVSLTTMTTVTATFIFGDYYLAVTKAGYGTGTVTSAPAGINCGVTCVSFFAYGTVVTLTATPDAGKNFAGWSGGGCSGMGACVISLTAATAVTATFTDTTPPGVTITGGPTNPSSVANPTFTFSADEAPVTFRCSLDNGPAFACTSPTTVSVGNGNHTFTVIATDPAGNATLPVSYSWTAVGIVKNAPIPTLNEWMLLLLALLVGVAGVLIPRRHNARRN